MKDCFETFVLVEVSNLTAQGGDVAGELDLLSEKLIDFVRMTTEFAQFLADFASVADVASGELVGHRVLDL